MVQQLLDYGSDPNQEYGTCSYSIRPLHFYAERGNVVAMRVALDNGAEVDPDGFPWSPLHEAAKYSIEAVRLLLEYGADLKARDLSGDTPAHSAAERGRTDIVRLLLERWPAGLLVRNNAGYTPLHSAACAGEVDVVRFLLEIWPEGKKSTAKSGRTPLMVLWTMQGMKRSMPQRWRRWLLCSHSRRPQISSD
jgi:hypothetical protein